MERHYVTVVFSDLCDSTLLAQMEDPEIVASLQSRIRNIARDLAHKHSGVVNQHYGDGILTLFGLPEPGEHDVVRALEFTLDLHAEISNHVSDLVPEFLIRLHSGVDSGLIVVSRGEPVSGVYEAFGDPLNIAARLSDSAAPNEIVANTVALGVAAEFFQTEALEPLRLKGVRHEVKAVKVVGRSGAKTRYEASMQRGLTQFAGRKRELERLTQARQSMRRGSFELVSIVGSAGVGKTRLIDEFLQEDTFQKTLRGYCDGNVGTAPLKPFLSMLESQLPHGEQTNSKAVADALYEYLESVDPSLTGHTQTLRTALALGSTPDNRSRPNFVLALRDWCAAMCTKYDIAFFIDDWQWADDASRELLGSIVQEPPTGFFLVSTRVLKPGDPAEGGTVVNLEPLEDGEARLTIERLIPNNVEPGTVSFIHTRSGGNPLFIEELCQSVRDQQPSHLIFDGEHLPATLSGLIEEKTARLSPEALDAAFASAVVGNEIPVWLLKELGSDTSVVAELAQQDIIYASDVATLKFKHGLTHDVIYSLVPFDRKHELHESVAAILQSHAATFEINEPVEVLAHHYMQSRNYEQSVHFSALAGDKALASNTLDRARHHYRLGIEALERLPKSEDANKMWLKLGTRWALACTYAPSPDSVRVLMEASARAAEQGNELGQAEAEYYLGWLHYGLGNQRDSIQYSRSALEKAERLGADKLIAQLFACIGQSAAAACDYSLAHEYLDRAIDIKQNRRPGSSPPIGWAYAITCKALVVGDEGDFTKAYELMDTALAPVQGSMQAIEAAVSNTHNVVRLWRGRYSEVIESAKSVQRLCERHSLPYIYASSRSSESYAKWILLGDSNALQTLRIATRQLEATEMQLYYSLNCGWMADVLSLAGEDNEAHEYAMIGLKYANSGDRSGEVMVLRALHRLATRGVVANLDSPEEYLQKAYDAAEARNSRHERAVTMLHDAMHRREIGANVQAQERAIFAHREFVVMGMNWHAECARELLAD